MADEADSRTGAVSVSGPYSEAHYKELRRHTTIRFFCLYLLPLILLATYFFVQYEAIVAESERLHLAAIAESQSITLDLFLSERRINLTNLINDPKLTLPPDNAMMLGSLARLQRISDAFVDIGYIDSSGVQLSYTGPYPSLEQRSYRDESWYRGLRDGESDFVITDIYLGLRRRPHFTIAVSRIINGEFVAFRASLDPERIYEYITSLEGAQEVYTTIVNREGHYQLIPERFGNPLDTGAFVPPLTPRTGSHEAEVGGVDYLYGYSWLRSANWALLVQDVPGEHTTFWSGLRLQILGIALLMILLGFATIVVRARRQVELMKESDSTRAQLGQAAKLASVGELAAGIAHEINNPLASINEEAGLMKDLMNPELGTPVSPEELRPYLDSIQQSVFRCRDITRKLLGFVRQTDVSLREHDVHVLIDEVVDGLLGAELSVSNIRVVREYGEDMPPLLTDGNQLVQVFLNIVNNAVDAMAADGGTLTIATEAGSDHLTITIADTGYGMSREQLENIFVPFYTTKEVGKGTGLGLSVSYGIVKSLGGRIDVRSSQGEGSTFTITLPTRERRK
ncbi:MAG: ATP-binding protein [candidate division Zixibacteria bacterium]|nr:ATP-binding protein [candidate division Zixibacteria bacterium]